MQIRVVGQNNCSRCAMVKKILTDKEIVFSYELLEDLDTESKTELMKNARKKGMLSMPLIIKDGELITIQEVTA